MTARGALVPALLLLNPGVSAAQLPAAAAPAAPAATPVPPAPAASANPYGRAIDLTVNIQFFKRDLGETALHMAVDGGVSFDAQGIARALKPLLNDAGQAALEQLVAGRQRIVVSDLKTIGVDAAFDRENVALSITAIDPATRKLVPLYRQADNKADTEITAEPAGFSFFLDTAISQTNAWGGPRPGLRYPSIYLNSAVRLGGFVLEGAGQVADNTPAGPTRDFRFDRNFVRLVYDRPELYLRSYLGDLTPEVRFQQNFVQMGGVGVSRQKRRFDAFKSAVLQGNRQLLLQRESTVDVYRNGVLFQQVQLAPGAYDLGSLPLLAGSNDVRLAVRDESGFSQVVNYQTYLDPIDLDPGDYEYGAYLGKLSNTFGLSPRYDGEVAFTGFFRKAFRNAPAVGFGLQASRSVQQVSGQTQFLLGSGRIDVTAAGSHSSQGSGYFAGLAYDLALDQSERSVTLSLQGTMQSAHFTGLGVPFQLNSAIANLSALISRSFTPTFSVQGGATYNHNRRPVTDGYRIFVDAYHQVSRQFFVRGGIDYQRFGQATVSQRRGGFGFNAALVWRPSLDDRAEARYDHRFRNAQLSYEHAPDGYVGSVGYGGILQHGSRQVGAQGYATYTGNRFTASASHSLAGAGFGNLASRQVTTVRASTAIAFADGAFAVARRVGDSFAILTPHPSLKGHRIIVGQLLTDSRYRSRSGALGGAVVGSLSSYIPQSVQYDVEDPPAGYDVGAGIHRVNPPYHSGYRLVVGTDAFATATGTLVDPSGKPVALTSGTIEDLARPGEAATSFFTNSVGRFAIPGVRPSGRYRVHLSSGGEFMFTVPADSEGLADLHTVTASAKR